MSEPDPPPRYPLPEGRRYTNVHDFYRMVGIGAVVVTAVAALLIYGDRRRVSYDALYEDAAGGGVAAEAGAGEAQASLWVDGVDFVGATVLIDGDSAGTVPLWASGVAEGERSVRVVGLDAAAAFDTTLAVRAGTVTELDLDRASTRGPRRAGLEAPPPAPITDAPPPPPTTPPTADARPAASSALRITSSPSGATVTVGGRRLGRTPLSLDGLRPGRHAVTVALDGYETMVRQVDLPPGRPVEAAVALRPAGTPAPSPAAPPAVEALGVVEILVRPWGRIEIDGETHRQETDVVYRAALAPGTHRVRVTHPRLGTDERAVTVRPGSRERVEFDLTGGGD